VDNSKGEFGIQGDFNNGAEGAHEQELMIFPAVEYDAGASFPPQQCQHSSTSKHIQEGERRQPSHFSLEFKNSM
jgi:hypothetical protein